MCQGGTAGTRCITKVLHCEEPLLRAAKNIDLVISMC